VTDAWEGELLPDEWEEGIVCPIYKKEITSDGRIAEESH
jgi:hypothetical protein